MAERLGKALQKLLQRFESASDLSQNAPDNGAFYMNKYYHYTGLLCCFLLIAACFLPWAHYNNINETFTGFNVKRFSTGNYYGKAGRIITIFTVLIFVLMLVPKLWAKRVNLFLSALLFAYCIRTYFIFTNALFEGEVEKKAGIYLIIIFSLLLLITSVFPKKESTS